MTVFNSAVVDWIDRKELVERASQRGRLWPVDESETYELVEPLPGGSPPKAIQRTDRTVSLDRPFVCDLPNATLFGPDAVVRTQENDIVLEATAHGDETARDGNCKRNLFRNLVSGYRQRSGDVDDRIVCPLVDSWARTYFHWIVDALPKLQAVERYVAETGDVPQLVVPQRLPSWMERSLELAGYDRDDCIRWDGSTRSFERVVVPSLRREVDAVSINALRWLRRRMLANADSVERDWASRVYISRSEANSREVLNESALVDGLSSLGFESYVLENLSVDEQISLFSQADAVFGLHGSGFTNILFAEDATVVELFGSRVRSTVYYHMASGLGLGYGAIAAPSVDENVAVDVDRVTTQLQKMLD
ncbi:DUF563 domain-containing protein [Halovenus sp. WSH3]|uniref:DUF563 domain-containing protein n=1 Tax=Halovenus carboxidivorans TaxID=2692199 RepID=A0A6B0T1Y8_9EURY|nr:glycosyltransferase family 61 protein [Halovenus carboxidivorans]MXR51177.1 DUF563 domain-containing protein [Halovenus carboxidivorans]